MLAAILVHGGAGAIEAARESACREGCRRAAAAGYAVLAAGGSARAAAVAAVRVLEDDPEFNAGLGACLTREERVELDAAVMDGAGLRFGAVGAVAGVQNAVALADAVLEDGEHVLLVAGGAVDFAREKGLPCCDPAALVTPRARERMEKERARREAAAAGAAPMLDRGTVGAVAIDARGHVAAATSTGGITYKRHGRVGDTPLCGAGTYADDLAGAASATGHGEPIVRVLLTRTAIDLVKAGLPAEQAAQAALAVLAARTGARAGILVVDRDGRLGWHRTTLSMPYAWVRGEGTAVAMQDGI